MEWLVPTPDGRTLAVEDAADSDGRPVLELATDEAVSMQLALAPGIEGSWDDCVAQLTPWGFDVAKITVPVLLLHGGQDRAGPFSHGLWLASHIPGVETWFFDDEGHALREKHIEDINVWLLERSS